MPWDPPPPANHSAGSEFTSPIPLVPPPRAQIKGMTAKQQTAVLEKFRVGECNMLLATNVAEEGLDIPECNLVVRYDTAFSITSLIQSRGRARKRHGRFVVVMPDRDQGKYDSLLKAEENMKTVVLGSCVDVDQVRGLWVARGALEGDPTTGGQATRGRA